LTVRLARRQQKGTLSRFISVFLLLVRNRNARSVPVPSIPVLSIIIQYVIVIFVRLWRIHPEFRHTGDALKRGRLVVRDLIERGLAQHRAGRLDEAKTFYKQILKLEPRHPDALHLLGLIALQAGAAGEAIPLIERAIAVQGGNPAFHANLAQAYLALQRFADAHAAFRRAAELDPHNPQFATGAASCAAMRGELGEAERQLRAVVQRHPDFALAWFNLGNVLRDGGRPLEAADLYRRAIRLDPTFADAHTNLGSALHVSERFEEAEQAYRQSLALQPDSAVGHCNLASVLIDRGRFADAVTVCQQGIARARGSAELPELHSKLRNALVRQGKLTAALDATRAAAMLFPDNVRALWAYGGALFDSGNEAEGLEWLERARELQSDAPELRSSVAVAYLSVGDLQAGWAEREWRPERRQFVERHPDCELLKQAPPSLAGRNVSLLREQGLGDELFFLRFAEPLRSRGAELTCHADGKIVSLLERVPVLDRVIPWSEPPRPSDLAVLVGDLPQVLATPGSFSYLPRVRTRPSRGGASGQQMKFARRLRVFHPELPPPLALTPLPERLEEMKERLSRLGPPPYLGLTWRAGTAPEQQRGSVWLLHKEIPLDQFATALRGVNGTLLALQRNPLPGEIESLSAHAAMPVGDLTALNEDLEAMLALLALMDDYVGVSNTNMHLRAGTGRPARVLVPRPAEWRWMAAGHASPWFPGFRLYRQHADGGWNEALARLRGDLAALGL